MRGLGEGGAGARGPSSASTQFCGRPEGQVEATSWLWPSGMTRHCEFPTSLAFGGGVCRETRPSVPCAPHPVRFPGRGGSGDHFDPPIGFGSVPGAARSKVASRRNSTGVPGVSPPCWAWEEVQGREAGRDAGLESVTVSSWFLQPLLRVSQQVGYRFRGPEPAPPSPLGKAGPRPQLAFLPYLPAWSKGIPVLSPGPQNPAPGTCLGCFTSRCIL